MICEFAEQSPLLLKGRICKLDHVLCTNFDNVELVEKCPTLNAFKSGEPVGKIVNMDYRGIPKCFRKGKFGTFDAGMPPEYLRGQIRRKKERG